MEQGDMKSDFPHVLSGALSLSADDQQQLCAVLVRVTSRGAAPVVQQEEASLARAEEMSEELGAAEWLKLIEADPPWTKVQLLDDALGRVDDADEQEVLTTALNSLLREHPPLAVRRAVSRVAVEHPIGICVGATGLLLGLFAIGRGVLRLLF